MDREAQRRDAADESKSQFARLVSMFHSPGRTFGELGRSPAITAVLIATALVGALSATAVSRAASFEAMVRYGYERQIENMPGTFSRNMSDADRERSLEAMRSAVRLSRNFAPALGAIAAALSPVVAAGFFLLVFGILGSPGSYRVLLSTVAHAGWPPAAVSSLLTCLVVRLSHPMPPERAANPILTSLDGAIPGLEGAAAALASRIELFLAWELALTTLGFAVALGISRRRSFAVALSLWALTTALAVAAAILTGIFGFQVGVAPA